MDRQAINNKALGMTLTNLFTYFLKGSLVTYLSLYIQEDFLEVVLIELQHATPPGEGVLAESKKKRIFLGEILTSDPSIYTMDHSKFIVSNQKEGYIST